MQSPGLQTILGSDLAAGDLIVVRDVSVTASTGKDKKLAWSELVSAIESSLGSMATEDAADYQAVSEKDQPDGYAGLNSDGQIVGPVIVGIYADAAAAGALPNGVLAKVGVYLVCGDGSTTGGKVVSNQNRIDRHLVGTTSGITLDPYANRGYVAATNPGITISITNDDTLPDGYEVLFATPDDTATLNFVSSGGDQGVGSANANPTHVQAVKIDGTWTVVNVQELVGGG